MAIVAKFRLTEYLDEIEIRRYWLYPSNSKRPILRLLNWISFSFSVAFFSPLHEEKEIPVSASTESSNARGVISVTAVASFRLENDPECF